MVDVTEVNVSSDNVSNAGMYLFYAVLSAIASLASLIVIVAVLAVLLTKLGVWHFIKLK